MKVIFAGTPEFAGDILQKLIAQNFEIVAVYTQPDRINARNNKVNISEVKSIAIKNSIPIEQPINFKNDDEIEKFTNYKADVFIVAAYGLILPQKLLDITKVNINVHASLLPKWRGAAPIQHSILNGDKITGVTIMEIIKELDAGAIINQRSIAISESCNTISLMSSLAMLGADALIETLRNLDKLWDSRTQQLEQSVTFAPKIEKSMAKINWQDSAVNISRKIRAYVIWPKAYCEFKNQDIKILSAAVTNIASPEKPGTIITNNQKILVATKDFYLEVTSLQFPNKKPCSANEVICGYKDKLDTFN